VHSSFFDLLGFGTKDASVIIDDVQLLTELSQAPMTEARPLNFSRNIAAMIAISKPSTISKIAYDNCAN